MAIDNNNIIDFIGVDKESNKVILTISDHLGWELKMDHLLKLQAKVNRYLDFIENGEIYNIYPNSVGKKIMIEISGKYNLPKDDDVDVFYYRITKLLNENDVDIRFKKI